MKFPTVKFTRPRQPKLYCWMHLAVFTALPLYDFLSQMKCQDRKITLLTLRIKCSSITANHSGNCIIKENIWNSDWLLAFGWRAVLKHPLHKYLCSCESLFVHTELNGFLSGFITSFISRRFYWTSRNKVVPKLFTEFVWIIGALEKSPGYPEMNCCNLQFTWTAVKQFTKYRIEKLAECLLLCPVLFIVLVSGTSNYRERSNAFPAVSAWRHRAPACLLRFSCLTSPRLAADSESNAHWLLRIIISSIWSERWN